MEYILITGTLTLSNPLPTPSLSPHVSFPHDMPFSLVLRHIEFNWDCLWGPGFGISGLLSEYTTEDNDCPSPGIH